MNAYFLHRIKDSRYVVYFLNYDYFSAVKITKSTRTNTGLVIMIEHHTNVHVTCKQKQ